MHPSTKFLFLMGVEKSEQFVILIIFHSKLSSSVKKIPILRNLLLEPNVDVNDRTSLGQTPLHLAAKNGHVEPTRLLLIRGADLNMLDNRGCSPLHLAADCPVSDADRKQAIELLSMMGADINARTKEGETALSLSLNSSNLDIFKQLLEKGADYKTVNLKHWTLLHTAAEKNICVVLAILDHKDSNCLKLMSRKTTLDTGMAPLHLAAQFGHLDMVKQLVERNLFLMDIKDRLNQTALHVSIVERHLQVAEYLINRGWDVNDQASSGNTCLHLAVQNNHVDAVKLLLAKGASVDVPDSRGWTPLQYAMADDLFQIAVLLQVSGQQLIDNRQSMEISEVDWSLKTKKRHLVLAHLNNLKLNLALHRFFTFPADYDRRSQMKRQDLAHSGFFFTFDYQSIQCFFCSLEITSLQGWKGLTLGQMNLKHSDESVQKFGQMCPLMAGEDVRDVPIVNPTNYNYEAHRLFSLLERRWTNPNVSVYDLAQKGFYFTGQDDNCRCWFCKLEVRGWEPGDTAIGEHNRWNPRCSFLKPNDETENVPIGCELISEDREEQISNPFVKIDINKCE